MDNMCRYSEEGKVLDAKKKNLLGLMEAGLMRCFISKFLFRNVHAENI